MSCAVVSSDHHWDESVREFVPALDRSVEYFLAHVRACSEADEVVSDSPHPLVHGRLTFHKLLVGILLIECMMRDRTTKVFDHDFEHRLNVFFSVSRIVL